MEVAIEHGHEEEQTNIKTENFSPQPILSFSIFTLLGFNFILFTAVSGELPTYEISTKFQ